MAEEKNDIKLDGDIATWEINMAGNIKGVYMGVFKFRCYLTPLQQIAAGRDQRALLGDHMSLANDHESFLAYALSQLKYRILAAPPFWAQSGNQGDIADEEVVEAVLDAAIRAELAYKTQIKKKKEESMARINTSIKQKIEEDKEKQEDPVDDVVEE